MSAGLDIQDLKKMLAKKPKSLLFACLADELRATSSGTNNNLEDALVVVNKGLLTNPDFLQGRLARGRIFFDKEDFSNAAIDFEFVAERDPYCLSAQKLLLESLQKLNKSPETEIHAKILGNYEPEIKIPAPVAKNPAKPANPVNPIKNELSKKTNNDVLSALDDILKEEVDEEIILINSILETFEKIFGKSSSQQAQVLPEAKFEEPLFNVENPQPLAAPSLDNILSEQLAPKIDDKDLPDLSKDMNELLASVPDEQEPELIPYAPPAPSLDNILSEQLAPKIDDKDLPNLSKDMNELLASVPEQEEPEPLPAAAKPEPSHIEAPLAAPSLDDILNEQLASKVEDKDLPNLTSDMDALLASAPPLELESEEREPLPAAAPSIDDILSEQLAPKVEDKDLPNLTSDMDALLASAPPLELENEEREPLPVAESKTFNAEAPLAAPSLDEILNEQLASKVEDKDIPDLTGDMNALLADQHLDLEPKHSFQTPNIDDILSEQLAPKVDDKDIPNLTSDMDALLADQHLDLEPKHSFQPSAPSIDEILNEQLASKVEDKDLPNLTGDMDALLASAPAEFESGPEPELIPYVPPEQRTSPAQYPSLNLEEILSEQLAPKIEDKDFPDLTDDMDKLLASAPDPVEREYPNKLPVPSIDDILNEQLADKTDREESLHELTDDINALLSDAPAKQDDTLAQNPTPTLAELYLSQNLPQKAAEVYKKLIAQNPGDTGLQAKLAQAEALAQV